MSEGNKSSIRQLRKEPKIRDFKSPIEALFGEDFNLGLFLHIARRNLIWLILIIVSLFSLTTLFLRYQVSQYQATSTLLLKESNSPNLIDIEDLLESNTDQAIQQEVEIIKSSRFLIRALQELPLDWVLYNQGNVLARQYYRDEPFEVETRLMDSTFVNVEVNLIVQDEARYKLQYSWAGQSVSEQGTFGRWTSTPHFGIKIDLGQVPFEELTALNLYFVFRDPVEARRQIAKSITIGLANYEANKLALSFRDESERKAMDIVNSVATAIVDYEYAVKSQSAGKVITFLDSQIDTLRQELFASENRLRQFKEENKLINPVVEEEYLRGQYVTLEERNLELSLENTTLDWLESYIEDTLNSITTILPPKSEFIDFTPYVTALSDLQEERRVLLASVLPSDPRVLLLDVQIDKVKDDFREGLYNAREKLDINQSYLDQQIEKNDILFAQLPEKEAEYVRLTRLNEIREKFYLLLLEKRAEFEIARAGLVSDYVLLENAYTAELISTSKTYLQFAAVALGLMIGISLIVFKYMFHNTITSLRDLEKYCTADILGVVPRVPLVLNSPQLVISNSPKSLVSEAFRSLRTNLDFLVGGAEVPKIAITSTVSGEGKTFIIANLGLVLTLLGKKVVVVDFDMRKPKLHKTFGKTNELGSSTILIGKDSIEKCLTPTDYPNLWMVPSGPIPPNPSELMASEAAKQMLTELQEKFDVVLVDTPPVGLVADALEVLDFVDVPIYVVRANYSHRSFIKNINGIQSDGRIKNLSLILNDAGMSGASYGAGGYGLGYGHGYGYGYGYGYRYGRGGRYGYYYDQESSTLPSFWQRVKAMFS